MPSAPQRFCAQQGCSQKVLHGYCDEHRPAVRQFLRRFQTGETAYNSSKWVKTSRRFKADHPFCINKGVDPDCMIVSDITDHIIPHRGDPVLFWDETNWQPMCWRCHSRKTAHELTGGR